jgi:hypothetical protein
MPQRYRSKRITDLPPFPSLHITVPAVVSHEVPPALGMWAVSAVSQSVAENTSKFRFSTGCILER